MSVGNAMAAPYTFTNIVDSTGPLNHPGLPFLNNSGTVAFGAEMDTGGSGIFTGNGGRTTTIIDTSGPFVGFGGLSFNNAGTVAFQAFLAPFNGAILTGNGGPTTTVFTFDEFEDFAVSFAINDHDTVALLAERANPFRSGIYTGSGGPLTTLYELNADASAFGNYVPFNDSGTVAFLAGFGERDDGIVTGNGGALTTIADSSGAFSFFYSSEENPTATYSLNDNGTVAFLVNLDAGGAGIFTGNGGATGTVVDTTGPFAFFPLIGGGEYPTFSLNNTGTVAFLAALDTGPIGIFTGPDPLADAVVNVGDSLFDSTVVDILMGAESLNDRGQIAFRYQLADGRTGIALADPLAIPEAGTLALLGLGLAGFGFACQRHFGSR